MADLLSDLSTAQLETLQTALDPLLDGFGGGESCLDDAQAYLARLGIPANGPGETGERPVLVHWLEVWRQAGGNRRTLAMAVDAILAERRAQDCGERLELVWAGADGGSGGGGVGGMARDQAGLIRQLVGQAEQRLLITTGDLQAGPFAEELFALVQRQMAHFAALQVRLVCAIHRPGENIDPADTLVEQFRVHTWPTLWSPGGEERDPEVYVDPRSTVPSPEAGCHVRAVVADHELLITSANLTDAAQVRNVELGVRLSSPSHANATWRHLDGLIHHDLLQRLL